MTEFATVHPEIAVATTYGSSGTFYQQIQNGAPFDLYLSADLSYPRQLVEAGLADEADLFEYAVGRLVVWAPLDSPVDPTPGIPALLDPAARKVSIANPEHAPYGRAAVAALQTAGVYDAVAGRLVLGENVAQAAEFVQSGNAQVGIIALSGSGRRGPQRFGHVRLRPDSAGLPARGDGTGHPQVLRLLPPGYLMDWQAIELTARLATATTAILLVLAVPLAGWLAFSRRRWTVVVEAVIALPLVLPPTVLGFYVLVALGRRSPVGRWWESLTGATLPFTFTGLLIASVLYSLPFAVQPLLAAFAAVDPRLREASTVLGRTDLGTLFRVVLPLARAGLATAAVLTFAHTVGEFGVVLMVGGNIAGETRTLSISIYDSVQALDYDAAGRTSLALLAFSLVVLTTMYALQRRGGPGWTVR